MTTNNENKSIKEAIVETIAFFDLFSFPLSVNEIRKYIRIEADYLEIQASLESLLMDGQIETKESLFFLTGKKQFIDERKKRYNYSDRKFKIAKGVSRFFRLIPWIRLICVANIIGRDNLRDKSDIDLFIVTDRNKLWLTRLFSVFIAKVLNVRPKKNNSRDKICLSFFISEEQLDLSEIKGSAEDRYFDYWFLNLSPIFSRENAFADLIRENDHILKTYPNFFPQMTSDKRKLDNVFSDFYKRNWDLLFGRLESRAKKFQLRIMPLNLKRLIPEGKGVIVSDKVIKLHLNDRREKFLNRYRKNLSIISR